MIHDTNHEYSNLNVPAAIKESLFLYFHRTAQGQRRGKMVRHSRMTIAAMVAVLLTLSVASFGQRGAGTPEFSLRSLNGQTVTSESLRGEVVVLAFGASWLP